MSLSLLPSISNTPLSAQTIIVPAAFVNGSVITPGINTAQLSGQTLVCRSATAPLQVKMDGGAFFPIEAGFVIPGPSGGFTKITLANSTTTAIVVVLYAGELGINVIPGNSAKVFSNYTKGTDLKGGTALAAAGTKIFNGLDPANASAGPRKQITVQNMDAGANPIEVQDASGTTLAVIPANSPPWTLETAGTVKVLAPAGASRIVIGEVFYTT